MSKINNQYFLAFVYEETLNCLKSHENKRIKILRDYLTVSASLKYCGINWAN